MGKENREALTVFFKRVPRYYHGMPVSVSPRNSSCSNRLILHSINRWHKHSTIATLSRTQHSSGMLTHSVLLRRCKINTCKTLYKLTSLCTTSSTRHSTHSRNSASKESFFAPGPHFVVITTLIRVGNAQYVHWCFP
jgi:hypothetical protein